MFGQEFAHFSIFAGLDGSQISQLSPYIVESRFPKGSMIFAQGKPANFLYILLDGEVVINYKPYDGPPLVVAHIEPGGVFGWSAALGRENYTSSATAVQDSLTYRLRGVSLLLICEKYPDTGQILLNRLASVIAERLQSTHTQVLGILSQGLEPNSDDMRRKSKNDRK
jgi:CRP-like cAMP-binding protein